MPYTYKKQIVDGKKKYCVYKKDTGKKVGCTKQTKKALKKYLNALYLNAENLNIKSFKEFKLFKS